jgi:hypothetical protein
METGSDEWERPMVSSVRAENVRTVQYRCERCGEAFSIPAGSTPRQLKTATSIAANGGEHFVIRVRAKNVHRCAIDQPDQEAAASPVADRQLPSFGRRA